MYTHAYTTDFSTFVKVRDSAKAKEDDVLREQMKAKSDHFSPTPYTSREDDVEEVKSTGQLGLEIANSGPSLSVSSAIPSDEKVIIINIFPCCSHCSLTFIARVR